MDKYCKEIWPGIVDHAEGRESDAARQHLAVCRDCQQEFAMLKKVMANLYIKHFEPPTEIVKAAAQIMPKQTWKFLPIKATTLAATGARGSTDFQVIFEEGPLWARLYYQRFPGGWSVSGRISSVKPIRAFVGDDTLTLDEEGRFTFSVADLGRTGINLQVGDDRVQIPPASEIQSGEPAADR